MSLTDVSAIDDVRIDRVNDLVAPNEIISRYPVSEASTALIRSTRAKIAAIMRGDDKSSRGHGPCSIHDHEAALEYATRLMHAREQWADKLEIVMRTYFEKPRTSLGWKDTLTIRTYGWQGWRWRDQ